MNAHTPPELFVPAPSATYRTFAYAIRGYNMGAIRDGWIVYAEPPARPPHDGLVDELCLAKEIAGKVYLRFLKRGRTPGRWDLLSVTGPAMLDVELEWATLVDWIKPHTLSKQQIASLENDFTDIADAT